MFYRYLIDCPENGPADITLCDECEKEVNWTSREDKESGGCEHQGDNCEEN